MTTIWFCVYERDVETVKLRVVLALEIVSGFVEVVLYLSPESPDVPADPADPVGPAGPVAPMDPVAPLLKVSSLWPTYWYAIALIPPFTPFMKFIAETVPAAAADWNADSLIWYPRPFIPVESIGLLVESNLKIPAK